MKKILHTLCLISLGLFTGTLCLAQKQNVYFLKNDGTEVSTKDSADFIRTISESPDAGSKLYDLKEYYANGIARRIGQISAVSPLKFEGQCITYFQSGNRKNVLFYKNGIITGDEYEYFPNGKIYCAKKFSGKSNDIALITSCNDSLGKELVVDGNGHCILYTSDFLHVDSEGEVSNGLRNGEWSVRPVFVIDSLKVTETYDRGKFLSGTSIDKAGYIASYQQRLFPPTYKGGTKALYQFLSSNVNRDLVKRKSNLQASIRTSFMIEKDGSISNLKISKSASTDLDDEALRLINLTAKNWQPAIYYGRPARSGLIQNINFAILLRTISAVY